MEYIKTNHSVCQIGYHLILVTKYRHQVLVNEVEVKLKRILSEICISYGWKIKNIEIMPDHVHLFIQTDHKIAPINIVNILKSTSTVYIFKEFPALKGQKFWGSGLWSKGAFYSTVGHISEDSIKKYIESQKTK